MHCEIASEVVANNIAIRANAERPSSECSRKVDGCELTLREEESVLATTDVLISADDITCGADTGCQSVRGGRIVNGGECAMVQEKAMYDARTVVPTHNVAFRIDSKRARIGRAGNID